MVKSHALVGTLCVSMFCAASAAAQEYSSDGKRWYEVEVSVFTNELPSGAQPELAVASKLTAAYLPRLRELQTRSSAFLIDFPQDQPAFPVVTPSQSPFPALAVPESLAPVIVMGPLYSPAVRDGFKITDFARDAFVDLDTRAAQFSAMNRSIDAAFEHRLLWHKVWRQPMEGRAQTAAVFVSGGDLHGLHTDLEGSLRLSDNAGGVMLDINIWLNRFRAGLTSVSAAAASSEWKIPELPFPQSVTAAMQPLATSEPSPELLEVWQLAQTRDLGANQLYYLDHPALGVLIQIRPYVLPERLAAGSEDDF